MFREIYYYFDMNNYDLIGHGMEINWELLIFTWMILSTSFRILRNLLFVDLHCTLYFDMKVEGGT